MSKHSLGSEEDMGSEEDVGSIEELHVSARWYYSYDLYTDHARGLEVKDDVVSFDNFKLWTPLVFHAPKKARLPLLSLIGNKSSDMVFILSTDESKKFVRSLIEVVQGNMKDGNCLQEFNESHIVLTHNGEVRFKNVGFVPKNDATKKKTYDNTCSVITRFFGDHIPSDLLHLTSLIGKQHTKEHKDKEELYPVHPSIVPHMERGWKFLTLFEVLKSRTSQSQRDMILLRLPYLLDWRTVVHKNVVLMETFYHKSSDYNPLRAFHADGRPTTEHEKKLHEAEKFLDFVRNGIAHRLQRKLSVTPAEHETIISAYYPLLLPHLQEAIFDVLGPREYAKHFNVRFTTVKRM